MKILFLTYYFPPLGGAGVQRALKFAKYLPEFGITPVVIAADEPGYITDESLLAELLESTEVYRIRHIPLLSRAIKLVRSCFGVLSLHRDGALVMEGGAVISTTESNNRWRDMLLKAYTMTQFPDDKSSWGKRALKQGAVLLQQGNIDLIFSSSPCITAHFVASKLKHRFGIPWVADFRDLWTGNPAYGAPSWRRWLDHRAELGLLVQTDGVTAVTKEMVTLLGYGLTSGREAMFLPNGYDEADFAECSQAIREDDRFILLYAGSLYGHQSPEGLFLGVRHLLRRRPELAGRLCLRFIGSVGSRFERLFAAFERDFPRMVERFPYVPHKKIPASLLEADALLLLIGGGGNARGVLTGKVFEYLRAGRPVLLIGPQDGEAAHILEETGCGVTVEEGDFDGVADIIEKWMSKKKGQKISSVDANIARFERRELTGQLAKFLRKVHGEAHV